MTDVMQGTADLAIAQMQASASSASKIKLHGQASMETIDKNSKDFEGMFMTQMLQPMFEGLGVDPMFGGGHGEEVMRSFLIDQYGKAMAKNGHLGIADAVKKAMIRAQDASNSNQPNPSLGAAYAAHR
jgi:Rod binding domain-containing protein